MPRRYRYRRYTRPKKSVRYSNETLYTDWILNIARGDLYTNHKKWSIKIIPETNLQGLRKIKNITLNLALSPDEVVSVDIHDGVYNPNFYWALVYVPEGQGVGAPVATDNNTPFVSLYEPNQNVIISGVMTAGVPMTRKTRLSRNLNSGDSIYLIVYSSKGDPQGAASNDTGFWITCTMNYAICYN